MTLLKDTPAVRWRDLLDTDQPILADGAMGTMLFANVFVRRIRDPASR